MLRRLFQSYVENRFKDKHMHKNKHDHMQTQILSMFLTLELLYGTQGMRKRKNE
jgi:hypothetical protein